MTLVEAVEARQEALTAEDVARVLGISLQQTYRLAAKGQIPCLKIASSVRFDPHDVAAWMRAQSGSSGVRKRPTSVSKTTRRVVRPDPTKKRRFDRVPTPIHPRNP